MRWFRKRCVNARLLVTLIPQLSMATGVGVGPKYRSSARRGTWVHRTGSTCSWEACAGSPLPAPAWFPGSPGPCWTILGDRSRASPALTSAMSVTGLTHLTAVSGLKNAEAQMGRQAVTARYRRRSGAHLPTHLTTLVICWFGRKISGPAVTDLPRQRWLVRHRPRRWRVCRFRG